MKNIILAFLLAAPVSAQVVKQNGPSLNGISTAGGNLNIPAGVGISQGVSGTTMSVSGMLFYASSMSISGSTYSAAAAWVDFASYVVPANLMFNNGDELVFECQTVNGAAPANGNSSTRYNATSYSQIASNTAGVGSIGVTHFFKTATGLMDTWCEGWTKSAANSITSTACGTQPGVAFDWTANSLAFTCSGFSGAGGSVNFLYMKVSKR